MSIRPQNHKKIFPTKQKTTLAKITFEIMFKDGSSKKMTGHYSDIIEKMGARIVWIEPLHTAIRINKNEIKELN